MMKKLDFTFFLLFLWMITLPVHAATVGTLAITGIVPLVNELQVTPFSAASNLDILGGENDKLIAQIAERSNSENGYSIEAHSIQGGKLVHSEDTGTEILYQISYDGGPSVSLQSASSPSVLKVISSLDSMSNYTSDVNITVQGSANAPSGNYSDTIVFSIVAN